jgi:UDP-N-acetylmuramoylalanine--D-glutamate ligase
VRDLDSLASWTADWRELRVLVLGLGVTGFAAADTLAELGASVLVAAAQGDVEREDLLSVIGARFVLLDGDGGAPQIDEFDAEIVIVSPGFRPDHAVLVSAQSRGVPVWGDIELAWRVRDKVRVADWILVTGTNGKTTTVQLATHLLNAAGQRAVAVGNIGVPVLDAVRDPTGFDVLVVELSSFQLHWMPTAGPGAIAPLASACLNLAEDHYDWHGSAAAYRDAKAKVYANTSIACVYNKSDAATESMVEQAEVAEGCRAIGFALAPPGQSDLGVVGGIIVDRAFLDDRHIRAIELTTHGELAAAGLAAPHSVENVLAASALARAAGVEPEIVREALAAFRMDHHRVEPVATIAGVDWVDDSKATNPHAASASLRAFDSVVWIVGGLLKGVEIDSVVERNVARLRAVIAIGTERTELRAAFQRHAPQLPFFEVETAETSEVMQIAVRQAAAVAVSGDVVLLAPAAASMDQFVDYADRGNRFAEAVRAQAVRAEAEGANDDHRGSATASEDSAAPE